jgi:hypothetical protein
LKLPLRPSCVPTSIDAFVVAPKRSDWIVFGELPGKVSTATVTTNRPLPGVTTTPTCGRAGEQVGRGVGGGVGVEGATVGVGGTGVLVTVAVGGMGVAVGVGGTLVAVAVRVGASDGAEARCQAQASPVGLLSHRVLLTRSA